MIFEEVESKMFTLAVSFNTFFVHCEFYIKNKNAYFITVQSTVIKVVTCIAGKNITM